MPMPLQQNKAGLAMAWCTFPFLKNFNDSLILPVLPFTMWFFADGLLGFALQ